MSDYTSCITCPACGNDAALGHYDDGGPYSVRCPRCGVHCAPGSFSPNDYVWVSPSELCPEEPGLVLVDNGGRLTVAYYHADESGDSWHEVGAADGSCVGALTDVRRWAALSHGCHTLPFPPPDTSFPVMYQWGPAWFWFIPEDVCNEGEDIACGPFADEAEAESDLQVKLEEIAEMG